MRAGGTGYSPPARAWAQIDALSARKTADMYFGSHPSPRHSLLLRAICDVRPPAAVASDRLQRAAMPDRSA